MIRARDPRRHWSLLPWRTAKGDPSVNQPFDPVGIPCRLNLLVMVEVFLLYLQTNSFSIFHMLVAR